MQTLLVANRGEIAVRILRAARELGLRTVAVYSEADRDAPHTHLADEAYLLGPPEPAQSYLDSARLLDVARASGADAVHPGYGFLAENAAFAEDCRRAGLLYVGPSVEAIRQMGSKILSKQIAQRAGVPVVPSYHAPDAATLAQEGPEAAARLGYPVLVKASAGGGGKGMRMVERPSDLLPALEAGAREAQQAFGDATLMLEKYIPKPRHIEVQVLGDHCGQRLHLYERECSIQRRHQKIVEETPAPAVDPALRQRLASAALRLAAAVQYTNAGTVEFLVGAEGDVYFLEMNTRLQVEHYPAPGHYSLLRPYSGQGHHLWRHAPGSAPAYAGAPARVHHPRRHDEPSIFTRRDDFRGVCCRRNRYRLSRPPLRGLAASGRGL